jgi:hypothetical protein
MSADDLSSKDSKDLDSITIKLSDYDHAHSDSVYTMGTTDTITLSSLTDSNVIVGGGYSVPWVTTSGVINPNTGPYTFSAGTDTAPWFTQNTTAPKIKLDGEGADIVVNGHSLVDAINSINDRLNCLQINPKLEAEWEELKALGDQYRRLEKHILEKQATWDRLKAMPPPDID